MNQNLDCLQNYPFEKLRLLLSRANPAAERPPVSFALGEPQHAIPDCVRRAYASSADELASYPPTRGAEALRQSIAGWLRRRYGLRGVSAERHILPVNGSREALFSFAQTILDGSRPEPVVVMPNPFYQIYEGAALLAGAVPQFINLTAERNFGINLDDLSSDIWRRTQLLYLCSPGNPSGNVIGLDKWEELFSLADRYDFVIAADECYSEIYFDETTAPLGALQAAEMLGRLDYRRLVAFNSLSKRSSVPGLRSGFVAGDAEILKKFLLYRTYHGSAMGGAVSAASVAAWDDESHVAQSRCQYREKFAAVLPVLNTAIKIDPPQASFFLWTRTPIDDVEFTLRLYQEQNVTVLPGSYLARDAHCINPGRNFVRIALVPSLDECIGGIQRISQFIHSL